MKKRPIFIAITLIVGLATTVSAQFFSVETPRLRLLYYSKGHEYIIPHLARSFENALNFHSNLFNYASQEKITVLLEDFGDFGNAGAISIPTNYVKVSIAPFSYVYEIRPANERMNWMMNHELVHIVASDKSTKGDRFFRSLFAGKVFPMAKDPLSICYSYLTNPREYAPRWYHEGAAVFMETWMAGGLGRAIGPYDEMVFRTKVRDSAHIYDIIGLESEGTTIDFQVGANSYLYGTRFLSYLAYHHGPDKLLKWISRDEDSRAYYSSQFRNVYQTPIDQEWRSWITWENSWQKASLDSIREFPVSNARKITTTGLGSVSRSFYLQEENTILSAIRYPGQVAHLAKIDAANGEITKLKNLKGAALYFVTSLAYDPVSQTVFYTTNNYGWRDLNSYNLKTGKSQLLIKEFRGGSLSFSKADSMLWAVRHFNGISTLVRIPFPYTEWDQVYSFPYGQDIFDIDVSPQGDYITGALSHTNGTQNLIKMDIEKVLKGGDVYQVLFDFEVSSPANFVHSPDGRYLYGSSYYSGVSNIYRYDFSRQDMDILSNAETGYFRPVPINSDSLIVFEYTGDGFIPAILKTDIPERVGAIEYLGSHIVYKYPELRTWTLGSPRAINIDSTITYRGEYNTISNLKLNSVIPIIQGFKDYVGAGVRFDFSDALGLTALDISASYSPHNHLPAEERFHFSANFSHWSWKIFTSFNRADFYDLFGPTKTGRRGYALGTEYTYNVMYDDPDRMDLIFFLEGWAGLETLPDFQNVAAPSEELVTARIALDYESVRKSLGAVDDEQGIKWQLVSYNDFVNKKFIFRAYNNLDFGYSLPINHSSLWLRTSVGYSFGERNDPFANFFFGGFGNNWIDHLSEKRYRLDYTFPGATINEFGGKNYLKLLFEWNLPPLRFRNMGVPFLFFNWMRTALFASAIQVNMDGEAAKEPLEQTGFRRTLFNSGIQVDLRLVLFSNLTSTFSLGYARAYEQDIRATDEFMISLKIM